MVQAAKVKPIRDYEARFDRVGRVIEHLRENWVETCNMRKTRQGKPMMRQLNKLARYLVALTENGDADEKGLAESRTDTTSGTERPLPLWLR